MSENYIVSARKYRPVTFASVVGQRPVTETLKNAIRTDKVAQAYLFCGPRGVGKTTCARILAKTLNCFHRTEDIEACDQCESCRSFREQRSFNIHELDAASNNSVEDIRQLCDQVRIPPQVGRYSIYIIDEVHMLSTQAFNAFLKTLEEPPQHAVFILATTEKHKIIPTILSRCQIFDFSRIRLDDIVDHLAGIAAAEGIACEPNALHVIAERADGGMRDALSIFDQMASFGAGKVTYQDVIANLNVLDYTYFFKITDACLRGDYAFNMLTFDEIIRLGFDGHLFINGLADHLRNLLVAKDAVTLKLLDVVQDVRKQYQNQAAACSTAFLFAALDICQACDAAYRTSRNQRLAVELALLKLSVVQQPLPDAVRTAPAVTALPDGGGPSRPAAPVTPPPATNAQPTGTPATNARPAAAPAPSRTASSAAVPPVAEAPAPRPRPQLVTPPAPPRPGPPEQPAPASAGRPVRTGQGSSTFSIKAALHGLSAGSTVGTEQAASAPVSRFPFVCNAVQHPQRAPYTEARVQDAWKAFADGIRTDEPRLHAALSACLPHLDPDGTIRCRFAHEQLINDFNAIRPDLLLYLRTRLERPEIDLCAEADPQAPVADTMKYYSPEAKLKHMKEINPVLQQLQQTFNLDIA